MNKDDKASLKRKATAGLFLLATKRVLVQVIFTALYNLLDYKPFYYVD